MNNIYHIDLNGLKKSELKIETDEMRNELFSDTIWKNKATDEFVRVSSCTKTISSESTLSCMYEYRVWFEKSSGIYTGMNMFEFKYLYELVGKCKYTDDDIKKLKWELKEEKDV